MTADRKVWIWASLALGLATFTPLLGCARDAQETEQGVEASSVAGSAETDAEAAAERAEAEVSDTTYADQGQPYGCTDDCSGHEAGYQWANEHEVANPEDCSGNSASFIEGCRARAEAYQEALSKEEQ